VIKHEVEIEILKRNLFYLSLENPDAKQK